MSQIPNLDITDEPVVMPIRTWWIEFDKRPDKLYEAYRRFVAKNDFVPDAGNITVRVVSVDDLERALTVVHAASAEEYLHRIFKVIGSIPKK